MTGAHEAPDSRPGRRHLCFHVSSGNDPEMDMVVFARSSIEAKRDWANEHGDGDRYIAGISAKRCKGWDKYAPGPVPAMAMIDDGWRFECHGCSRSVKYRFPSNVMDWSGRLAF